MKIKKNLLSGIAFRVSQRVPRREQYDSCRHQRQRCVHDRKTIFSKETIANCIAKVRIRPDGHSTKVFIGVSWYRHGHDKHKLCWQRCSVGTTRTQPNDQANDGLSRVLDDYSEWYVKIDEFDIEISLKIKFFQFYIKSDSIST